MTLNPIGIAIPFFLLLIGVEILVLRRQNKRIPLNDALTDMRCGTGDQLLGILFSASLLIPYTVLEQNFGLFDLSTDSAWTWIWAMLGVDLCYYAYHRFSHRVNIGWATHVVHHQSEEYNLCVALRQPWFSKVYSWVFYIPLAMVGVPVSVYAMAYAINLLYQFWIHTETIDRMPGFGLIFNTPAHHRVHHGTNPAYIDKNYAGILIVWDRLFGTFEEEVETPLYGTLKPLRSWDPIWANVGPWVQLAKASKRQKRFIDRCKIWFMPPEWTVNGPLNNAAAFNGSDRGYDVDHAKKHRIYILMNFILVSSGAGILITFEQYIPMNVLVIGTGFSMLTFMGWAGLFEGRRWAWSLETVRLLAALGLTAGMTALFAFS